MLRFYAVSEYEKYTNIFKSEFGSIYFLFKINSHHSVKFILFILQIHASEVIQNNNITNIYMNFFLFQAIKSTKHIYHKYSINIVLLMNTLANIYDILNSCSIFENKLTYHQLIHVCYNLFLQYSFPYVPNLPHRPSPSSHTYGS